VFLIITIKLLAYHIAIACKGITTYQDIKQTYVNDPEYMNRDICKNIKSKLCYKTLTAYFKPYGIYEVNFNLNETENLLNEPKYNNTQKSRKPMATFPANSTQKTIISRTLSNEYKVQPGELHQSEGEGEYPRLNTHTQNLITSKIELTSNNMDNDSLNKKIFSIIDSSGTIEDNDKSDGKVLT
jgi:hypothetical protein